MPEVIRRVSDWQVYDEDEVIVRCKDCKYQYSDPIDGHKQCGLPNAYTPIGDDNDYCSYGEMEKRK